MQVVILGCGTAGGTPRIGNDWGACDPTEPRNQRRRASVWLRDGDAEILIDASPDLRQQGLQGIPGVRIPSDTTTGPPPPPPRRKQCPNGGLRPLYPTTWSLADHLPRIPDQQVSGSTPVDSLGSTNSPEEVGQDQRRAVVGLDPHAQGVEQVGSRARAIA